MATTIGKLAAILTGNTKGFESAFKRAGRSLKSFASTASGVAAGLGIFAVVSKATNGIINFTKSSFESIDAAGKLSDTLGLATEKLIGLQHAAGLSGVSNEELTTSFGRMLKVLGEAKGGSASAIAALANIGLSVDMLKGKSPDEVFGIIADRLNGIADPSLKAAAAMEIFGKGALGIFPLLKEGSAGLAAMQAEAEKLGLSLSRVEAAKVEMANDALTKVGELMTGIGQRIAIELSPFIAYASDQLIEFAAAGGGVASKVGGAFEFITMAIAKASDYLYLFEAGWHLLEAAVIGPIAGIIKAIDMLGSAFVEVANLVPGVELQWTTTFSAMSESMMNDATNAVLKAGVAYDKFSSGENSKKVGAFFDGIRQKAQEAAEAMTSKAGGGLFGAVGMAIGNVFAAVGNASNQLVNNLPAAAEKAVKAASDAVNSGPKLLVAGSAEAASLRLEMQNKATADRQRQIAQNQLNEQKRMSGYLSTIADSAANFIAPVVARFA